MAVVAWALAPAFLDGQRLAYVGGGGGLLVPTGSFGDVEKAGWHVLGSGVGMLTGSLGFTVHAVYGQVAHQNDVEGKSTLAGGTVNAVLFLGGEPRRIRPFLTAGVGAFRVNVDVPSFGSAASTEFALDGGAGLLVGSGRRRALLVARYVSVRTPEPTRFLPISAGVMFPLGSR
jgi:hypothetical protein